MVPKSIPFSVLLCILVEKATSFSPVSVQLSSLPRRRIVRSPLFSTVEASSSQDIEDQEGELSLSFQDLGLSPAALQAVESQDGWTEPTPIQQLAIPRLLGSISSEEDLDSVWCEAPTGSGKTAAYVLPLLERLLKDRKQRGLDPAQKEPAITSLILCPTRELANQIGNVVKELASYTMNCNHIVITGGSRREEQLARLADWAQKGESADIVIATPGRLVDVLTRYKDDEEAKDAALERRLLKAMEASQSDELTLEQIHTLKLDREDDEGRTKLSNLLEGLQYLILDEADRLLGRAFEEDINAVLDLLKPENRESGVVKMWLFSATYPKLIEPRVESVLQRLGQTSTIRISCANSDRVLDGEEISSSLRKRLERVQQNEAAPKKKSLIQVGPASTIKLRTISIDQRDRTQALKYLIQENEKEWSQGGVLVFVATRYASEHVSRKLKRAGIRSAEVHGKLDQDARTRRLKDLESGKINVLLTTDLTARGIDLKGLSVVINYDLPRATADFVHRVGRTGRASKKGTAITFVTPTTEAHMSLIEKRHLSEPIPREVLPDFEVDEQKWQIQAESALLRAPGAGKSTKSLAFDRMHGGIKGKRKSKKDRLRERAAKEKAQTGGINEEAIDD